jgi:hypothetical protein
VVTWSWESVGLMLPRFSWTGPASKFVSTSSATTTSPSIAVDRYCIHITSGKSFSAGVNHSVRGHCLGGALASIVRLGINCMPVSNIELMWT